MGGVQRGLGVGGRGREGGEWVWAYSVRAFSQFLVFYFIFYFFRILDRSFSVQGYQGAWPIIGMQIAADGVPQQKKRTS